MNNLTRQALPKDDYLKLVGTAICVFNQNFGFIIENILHYNLDDNWYELVDCTSLQRQLVFEINEMCVKYNRNDISDLYKKLATQRNRLCHSLQCTFNNEQILFTKTKIKEGNSQTYLDREWLYRFIKDNEELNCNLYELRDLIKK